MQQATKCKANRLLDQLAFFKFAYNTRRPITKNKLNCFCEPTSDKGRSDRKRVRYNIHKKHSQRTNRIEFQIPRNTHGPHKRTWNNNPIRKQGNTREKPNHDQNEEKQKSIQIAIQKIHKEANSKIKTC